MGIAVVYKSKYGAAAQYAAWLSETCGAGLCDAQDFRPEAFGYEDALVYIGGLYAGGLAGFPAFKKQYLALEPLQRPRLIVAGVGIGPATPDAIREAAAQNLGSELMGLPFFLLRGRLDSAKLSWIHRALLGTIVKSLQNKAASTEREQALLNSRSAPADFMDRDALTPILDVLYRVPHP